MRMVAGVVLGAVLLGACAAAPSRPNVLMIVMDDLGWHDVGFRSHDEPDMAVDTPNIDHFAQTGLILDHYYVQDVCSPSRATFLSGMFPLHHGVNDWIPPAYAIGLPLNMTTLPDRLKALGYATHAVGKWHCGFFKWDYTPTFRGFDSFMGFYGGGEDYFTHMSSGFYDMRRDRTASTEVFTEEAVKLIQAHNTSEPLFLYLAYQAVHAPAEVPDQYVKPYDNRISNKMRRTFAGMLSAADMGIGNVTEALRERSMADNLLIVFTTDNGGPVKGTGDHVGACNWPLRGGKHSIWEGGTRGTAVVSGPLLNRMGHFDGLMHGADWMPTILEAVGDNNPPLHTLDGVSQWKSLKAGGCTAASCPRKYILHGRHDDSPFSNWENAYREGDLKVIMGGGGLPDTNLPCGAGGVPEGTVSGSQPPYGTLLLFNVTEDPDEKNDLSKSRWQDALRLNVTLAKILLEQREQQPDKSCPAPSHPKDPTVGGVWEPWC